MFMNIGIFETQHFEGAYPMIRIMDIPGNQLTIFADENTYNRFKDLFGNDMQRYSWIVKPGNVSNRRFIWKVYKICKKEKTGVLFLNTVSANFIWYGWMAALLPSTKVILTLHDANAFLRSRFSINFRRSIRHIGKKILGHFCYAYSTVSETVMEYLKNSMNEKKKIFCIPGAVYEGRNNFLQSYSCLQSLRLVVPGSIDGRRREYNKIFELLEQINKHSLPVIIVLAGGPYGSYGQTMLDKFRAYGKLYSNLIYYESPVLDQSLFDAELDNGHFVWIPSVIKTVIDDGIEETYGLTKSSGNIFDAIKHAKPLLVPKDLPMPSQLKSSTIAYDNIATLFAFLETITHYSGKYNDIAAEALSNSLAYTAEKKRMIVNELF